MATAVTITLRVDNAEGLAEIDAFNAKMRGIGATAESSFRKVGEGMNSVGAPAVRWSNTITQHSNSSLDAVRLLSQEFGLRLPRAMEAMLSRVPAVTSALSGALSGLAGLAAVEVLVRAGEAVHHIYTEYISLNAQADKFYETQKKAAQLDIGNTRTLEVTGARLGNQERVYANSPKAAQALHNGAISSLVQGDFGGAISGLMGAHQLSSESVAAGANVVTLTRQQTDQLHEQAIAQINLNHAQDATLTGAQRINAEAQKKKQLNAEQRTYDNKVQGIYGNQVPADAGAAQQRIADQTADGEAAAAKINLGRETNLAIMKADDARMQHGLSGEELYTRKMRDDIRETTLELTNAGKAAEIPARVREINAAYFDDLGERIVRTQNQQALSAERGRAGGLNGAARIEADHGIRINEINSNAALSPEAASAERQAAQTEANQKLLDLQTQFSDRMKAIEDGRVEHSLSGFQRIDAAAQKEVDRINQDFAKSFDGANPSDAKTIAAARSKEDAITAVRRAAGEERADLTAKNNDEDLQYAQQAARAVARVKEQGALGWVASYKNAVAEIQAQDVARSAKLQEQADKDGLTAQQVSQRKVDIDREANAEIAEQNLQMQHQIAGDLQAAFTNPIGFIKSQMEKMFFEIVAGWITRMGVFQRIFGQTMGGLQPGGGGANSGLGSILGAARGGLSMPGLPGTTGLSNGSPNISSVYGPASSTSSSGGGFGGAIGTVQSGLGVARDLGGAFGGGSSTSGSSIPGVNVPYDSDSGVDSGLTSTIPGLPDPSVPGISGGGGLSGASSTLSAAAGVGMGGYQAYSSTVNAFEKGSPLQGALGDAAAGAAIGSVVPGIGTAIGAGVGAAVGLASGALGLVMGEAGNLGARRYYEQNVLPTFLTDLNHPPAGDFMSGIDQVNQTSASAMKEMRDKYGVSAANWVNDNYMKKELAKVVAQLTATATGGRAYIGMQANQFHSGGPIAGFGDLGTSGNEGFIHAMLGETVMNPSASSAHSSALTAMNSGASAAEIASGYLAASGASMGGSHTTYNGGDIHVHTLDTKTMSGWLKNGGAQMITKHQNTFNGQYAGDGVSG